LSELNLAGLFQQLQSSGLPSDASQIGTFLRSLGISPENPETAKKLLEQAGLTEQELQQKENIISLINQMTASLSPEMRQQMSQIIEQTIKQLDCGELPQDLADFLNQWKKPE
jgi:predicted Zn-dependent peptidase